jgi:hypothetical protein
VDAVAYDEVPPNPAALIQAIRSIGYGLGAAVADIVDNSITAGATRIDLDFHWDGSQSWIRCIDDGQGMSAEGLKEAMRIGARLPSETREDSDLGRFGLGLKTASFSQGKRLSVQTRTLGGATHTRCWDLDHVTRTNRWELLTHAPDARAEMLLDCLPEGGSGTVVLWEHLDRALPDDLSAGSADKFRADISAVYDHLATCFHRFLGPRARLTIRVNGREVEPWDPFHKHDEATLFLPREQLGDGRDAVFLQGFVIPRAALVPPVEGSRYRSLTPRQGIYVYRERRLLVAGGWLGICADDPDFALARLRVDITNAVDREWKVDISKSKVTPPSASSTWLRGYVARLQRDARTVLRRREAVSRGIAQTEADPVWIATSSAGSLTIRINRAWSMLEAPGLASVPRDELEALLIAIETALPVSLLANPTLRADARRKS